MPECVDKPTQVYRDNGIIKNQLTGALTPEQRRQAEQQEQQRAAAATELESVHKEQRYLLAHYPTEQDVELMRQKALSQVLAKIAAEKQALETAQLALDKNHQDQRLLAPGSNALVMAKLSSDDLTQTIKQAQHLIDTFQAEQANINREYDRIHKRYTEIVLSGKYVTSR